ncbi:MAG: HD domain-containing protein [Clostridium sp.]
MNRIDKIRKNLKFIKYIELNSYYEKERIYCKHDITHVIDTSRIMYIISLEENLGFHKSIIYACGLLHDIGKWNQYKDGSPHEISGAYFAEEILKQCDFKDYEISEIVNAIKNHREDKGEVNSLSNLLYRGDKLSRQCYSCLHKKTCKWSCHKKNLVIKY